MIADDCHIVSRVDILCKDEGAMVRAKQLVQDLAVELWDGALSIAIFNPLFLNPFSPRASYSNGCRAGRGRIGSEAGEVQSTRQGVSERLYG